jgi:hypothetical protein
MDPASDAVPDDSDVNDQARATITLAPIGSQWKRYAMAECGTWTQPWLAYGPFSEPFPKAFAGSPGSLWRKSPPWNGMAQVTGVGGYQYGLPGGHGEVKV